MRGVAAAALLSAAVALGQAADSPTVVDVERGELVERGTGAHFGVQGGGYLNDDYWLKYAQELADKRAQLRYLRRDLPMYVASILLTGVALGYALERWLPGVRQLLFPG